MFDVNILYYFLLAFLYVILSSFAISKFTDMKRVKAFNEEMKKLQSAFWEATKNNDIKKMDELNKKQMQKTKEFPFLLKEQLKMSVISLSIFLLLFSLLDHIDMNKKDDIKATIDEKGKIFYINAGEHFLSYETLDKSKGEIYYTANESSKTSIFNIQNGNIKIEFMHDSITSDNSSLIKANISSSVPLHIADDNATRTEIEIRQLSLNIHGIWLFIVFSIILSLIKSIVKL